MVTEEQELLAKAGVGLRALSSGIVDLGESAELSKERIDAIVSAAQMNNVLMDQVRASHEIEQEEASHDLRIIRAARGTIHDQENELQKLISAYVKTFGTRVTGKTERHRKNGYFTRKSSRRAEHAGWCQRIKTQPHLKHEHPFRVKAA